MLGEERRLECERVVRDVEARIERFMASEDGEEPLELGDGVQSVLLGTLEGKSVQIRIHVQPGLDDDYWQPEQEPGRGWHRGRAPAGHSGQGEGTVEDRCADTPHLQPSSPESGDGRRADHQRDSDDTFGCAGCGAVFDEQHRLYLVRHRDWYVDECSNCGEPYQIGRAKRCSARLRAQTGIELELPLRAWLAVNELLHALGLVSFRQFEAMELDIGAGADAAQAKWISKRLYEVIKAAGGPRPFIEGETVLRGEIAKQLWTHMKEFICFARRSGGFSVF